MQSPITTKSVIRTGVTGSGGISGSVGYDNDFRISQVTVNGQNPIA